MPIRQNLKQLHRFLKFEHFYPEDYSTIDNLVKTSISFIDFPKFSLVRIHIAVIKTTKNYIFLKYHVSRMIPISEKSFE